MTLRSTFLELDRQWFIMDYDKTLAGHNGPFYQNILLVHKMTQLTSHLRWILLTTVVATMGESLLNRTSYILHFFDLINVMAGSYYTAVVYTTCLHQRCLCCSCDVEEVILYRCSLYTLYNILPP